MQLFYLPRAHSGSFVFPQTPSSNEPSLHGHNLPKSTICQPSSGNFLDIFPLFHFSTFPLANFSLQVNLFPSPASESFMGAVLFSRFCKTFTRLNMVSHLEFLSDNFAPIQDKRHYISTFRRDIFRAHISQTFCICDLIML